MGIEVTIVELTGFVRKLDNLGRITIPAELRRKLFIETSDGLEIFLDQDKRLVIRKYEPCDCDAFTGEINDQDDLIDFEGKKVSKSNIQKLAKLAGLIPDENEIQKNNPI